MTGAKRAFSRFSGQFVVLCLFALIIISLIAIFATAGALPEETPWIGMTVKPLEPEVAAALGIPSGEGGVMVGEVEGLARRSGLRHGDVLQSVNGKRVRDILDFSELVAKVDIAEDGAQLGVIRRGSLVSVLVMPGGKWPLGAQQEGRTGPERIGAAPVVIDRRSLGIEAETLGAGGARELGIPAGVQGVLVEAVARGSRAEQAGLAARDVIVSVNGQSVARTTDLWDALVAMDGGGDRVEFGVYRMGRLTSVALLPAFATQAGGFPGGLGGWGPGPGGCLICARCGTRVVHQRAMSPYGVSCPSCGMAMARVQ